MNKHLNIYQTYAKDDRERQLENDLTRAFAICLQESSLFCHEVLSTILNSETGSVEQVITDGFSQVEIAIQKKASSIGGFEKLFAVSLSEAAINAESFWQQETHVDKNPICDLVIRVNGALIIIETKPNAVDCTSQLFNQAIAIARNDREVTVDPTQRIVPVDLNWKKLMTIAEKVKRFQSAIGSNDRFLDDFIEFIGRHNPKWLPTKAMIYLTKDDRPLMVQRLELAFNELVINRPEYTALTYTDRIGFEIDQPWAKEVLFGISEDGEHLHAAVFPGNTKQQGWSIFTQSHTPKPSFNHKGKDYDIIESYHIKLTSFQRYFTGLWFDKTHLKSPLYTEENFRKHSGRCKKADGHWDEVKELFNSHFKDDFKWKSECEWDKKVLNSGKTQFDLSFGYDYTVKISLEELQTIDTTNGNLQPLADLLEAAYLALKDIYLP